MGENNRFTAIKKWAAEDRPREKLLEKGHESLTDSELLAILLRTGTKNQSAIEVARTLLHYARHDLDELGKISVNKIQQVKGIGMAKAITISAALELGRRRKSGPQKEQVVIDSAQAVYDYFYPLMADLQKEQFYVLFLRRNNSVIKHYRVSSGGVSGTMVDPKLVFKEALEMLSSALIICHNHPSGNPNPSRQDFEITQKIKDAGEMLDIQLLDHLIFTDKAYYSFAEHHSL